MRVAFSLQSSTPFPPIPSEMALDLSDARLSVLVEPYVVQLLAFPSSKACPKEVLELANSKPDFFSLTVTAHEISMLADEKAAKVVLACPLKDSLLEQSSWRALKIAGPLDLSMVRLRQVIMKAYVLTQSIGRRHASHHSSAGRSQSIHLHHIDLPHRLYISKDRCIR